MLELKNLFAMSITSDLTNMSTWEASKPRDSVLHNWSPSLLLLFFCEVRRVSRTNPILSSHIQLRISEASL